MSVIGDNIHALRVLNGNITQQELADIVGVSRETVNKWETGAIHNLRTSNIETMREHFGLAVDDLRSETCGLASRLGKDGGAGGPSLVPVRVPGAPSGEDGPSERPAETTEVPAGLRRRHPRSFAIEVEGGMMEDVVPGESYVIVDPELAPHEGSIVVCEVADARPVIRRMGPGQRRGVPAGGDARSSRDADGAHIIGTVVWCQPTKEFK